MSSLQGSSLSSGILLSYSSSLLEPSYNSLIISLNLMVNRQAYPWNPRINNWFQYRGVDSGSPRVSFVRSGRVLTFLFLLLRWTTNLTAMESSVAFQEYPRTLLLIRCLTVSSVKSWWKDFLWQMRKDLPYQRKVNTIRRFHDILNTSVWIKSNK